MGYEDLFQIQNQRALVVGGYGGIGMEVCRALASYRCKLVIAGRDSQRAEKLAAELSCSGDAFGIGGDATLATDAKRMTQAVVDRYGGIDILVNCVGFHIDAPAEAYREEDWERVLNANVKAAFLLSQSVATFMITQRKGKIIHFSSVRSLLGIRRGYVAYCSAKGAVNMLTKQLASEWAKYNIQVNAIAPTFIRTEQVAHYLNNREFYEALVNRIPLGRVGEPSDLAGAVIFLSSRASDFITGQILFVDGGVTSCQ